MSPETLTAGDSPELDRMLSGSPLLWRGTRSRVVRVQSSGFDRLDGNLPGGGWPLGALTEFIIESAGIGELTLTLPALRAIAAGGKPIAFVDPPYLPYAPALRRAGVPLKQIWWVKAEESQSLWAAEQMLRAGAGVVLLWTKARDARVFKRLQLAAESAQALAFVYRGSGALSEASPAAVRARLEPTAGGLRVDVLKVRGGRPSALTLQLARPPTVV